MPSLMMLFHGILDYEVHGGSRLSRATLTLNPFFLLGCVALFMQGFKTFYVFFNSLLYFQYSMFIFGVYQHFCLYILFRKKKSILNCMIFYFCCIFVHIIKKKREIISFLAFYIYFCCILELLFVHFIKERKKKRELF